MSRFQTFFTRKSKMAALPFLLVIGLSSFSSCYAFADSQSFDACIASIHVPPDDQVYANLAVAKYNKVHMTCPINVRKQRAAKIYILHGKDICERAELFGYSVVSHKLVTDIEARRMYGECSGVIHWIDKPSHSGHTTTYAWYAAFPDQLDRERKMGALFPKLTGKIISSGLPILQFVSENNVFCFEMDSDYGKDPLATVQTLGINIPPWVHQIRYQNKSCNALFHSK